MARDFRSRGFAAVVAASVASAVLGFIILVMIGQIDFAGIRDPMRELPVVAAIVLLWAPAFAFVPASILGLIVERPKARAMIERGAGGLVSHLAQSVAAALVLWLFFRIVLLSASSTPRLMDSPSLALFFLIGLCSAIAWWLLVIQPGRRA